MKTTKTSRFSKPSHILVGSIAACAVLGLASSASAAFYNWHNTENLPVTTGNLWSDAANWTGAVPAAGDGFRIEQYPSNYAGTGTIIMNVNYSAGALSGSGQQFFGGETVSIEQYFKTTHAKGVHLVNGGSGPTGSTVIVKSAANAILTGIAGTIDGHITFESGATRGTPTVEFAGGSWTTGSGDLRYSNNEQNGKFKVTSDLGTIRPNKVLVLDVPWQTTEANRFAKIEFKLAAAGVAPIELQAVSNPLDFQNAAAGTNPFKLNVDASLYVGVGGDIPLITHTTDTDRMFSAGNISITAVPVGKGAFVTQTNTGTTLTLADAGTWSGTTPTSWGTDGAGGNWSGGTAPGGAAIPIAYFPAGVVNFTANLNGATPTLAVLNINSGASGASNYSITGAGGGNINLGATPTGSLIAAAQINVLKGTSNTISAPVALNMDAQVNTAAGTKLTMSGAISGAFSLTKGSSGELVLSGGANSYTGATNINEGILEIGTAGLLGSGTYAGNIAMASGTTFRYNSTANQVLSGVISGVGTLQKQNTGTLTLSNANTFTSTTAVTGGKIALGHAQALQFSPYDVTGSNGTTIGVDVTGFPTPVLGGLTGSVNLASAMIGYSGVTGITLQPQTGVSVAYSGNITDGTGAISLTKSGAGTQTLSGINNFTGGVTLNAGTLVLGSDTALGAAAGTFTINGGTLSFNANPRTIANNNPISINGDFNVLGDQIIRTMGSGPVDLGTAAGTTRTITHTNGGNGNYNLTIGGVISNGTTANALSFNSSNTTVPFVLTGNNLYTGSTTVTAGVLGLMGSNASAGNTTIGGAGGTLAIGHNSALGTSTLQLNGGNIQTFGGDRTIANNATWGGNFTFLGTLGDQILPSGGQNLTIAGTTDTGTTARTVTTKSIGNTTLAGAVTYRGDHTFNFGGTDTYSTPVARDLTMSGGVILTGGNRTFTVNQATVPSTALPFANTATLVITGGIQEDVAGRALTKLGTGTMVVSGASSYSGTTTITAGALRAMDAAGLPSLSLLSFNGGVLEGRGVGSFTRSIANSAGNNVFWTGNGGFAANGGKLTVTPSGGDIDFGAAAGFNAKTLILGSLTANAEVEVTNAINLANSTRTVQVDNNLATAGDFATLSGVISSTTPASGALTKTGTGTLALSGTNTYEGTTTISAGALRAVSGTGLPTNSLLSFNGGVLEGSGVGSFTRNIANSPGNVFWTGNGGFAANGGKLTVTPNAAAPIDWSAATGFSSRTLIFGSSTANAEVELTNDIDLANGTRTVQVDDNAYTAGDFAKLSGVISSATPASGLLVKTGAGTLALSGTNIYSGSTTISAGALRANNDAGLPGTGSTNGGSFLRLDGGVLEGSGVTSFTRANSNTAGGGNFNWVSANGGGFSANGGKLTVTIANNAATTQVWGAAAANNGIVGILKFGSATANDETEFQNPINLNNAARTIQVDDNADVTTDFATISGVISSTAAASGTLVKTGLGLLVLTANNSTSYTGKTYVAGGVLRVPTLANLSGGNLTLRGIGVSTGLERGGVLETQGTFTRALGTGANTVDFANHNTTGGNADGGFTGGFSAFGGNLTINLGGASAENVWNRQWAFGQRTGARQFYSTDAVMVFNSVYSDGMVNWQNPLALGGALGTGTVANGGLTHDSGMTREIRVNDNPNSATDFARFSGLIRDGDKAIVTNNGIRKSGTGLLELTAGNTYTGTTFVDAGTLAAVNTTALGTAASGTTVASGATLDVRANIGSEAITVGGTGVGGAGALITATTLTGTVGGTVTLTGATSIGGAGTGILNIDGVVAAGANTLTTLGTGETTFGAASTLTSVASLAVADGTTNVNSPLGTAGNAVVTVSDTAGGVATKLRFGTVSQTLSSLTIGAGATVIFTSGAASGSLTGDDGGGKAAGFGSPASSFGGGATVPEPGTLGLLLVGALGMLNRRRRQA